MTGLGGVNPRSGGGGPHHPGGGGPPGPYEAVTGTFQEVIDPDDHSGNPHARFAFMVNGKKWEADINVHSVKNPDGSPGGSPVEYAIVDKLVSSMPTEGIMSGAKFSYAAEGMTQPKFQVVTDTNKFHDMLENMGKASKWMTIYGVTYQDADKNGIHDVHMNTGEANASANRPNKDGVIKFYTQEADGIHEHTVFIKFQSQHFTTTMDGSAPTPQPQSSVAA